jgi:hypothetical protein
MTDYSTARYWAISGLGYGKGFTPAEAVDNYIKTQMRNHPARTTVFKTAKAWRAALTTGECRAQVWKSPEGYDGFTVGIGSMWTRELPDGSHDYRQFRAEDRVDFDPATVTA